MSAASVHYSARAIEPDAIESRFEPDITGCIAVHMPDLSIFLPHAHALRLVDQLTAALAQHKAAHDFHRGAGGAG